MKKIFFIILIFLCVLAAAYLIYLNEIILPEKIRIAVVDGLSGATGKNVTLASAKLDIFRGLVLKDLAAVDENSNILTSKDVSCRFLILPLLKKQIVITSLKFDSPEIFVERFPDNSINIVETFFKKPLLFMKGEYSLTILRIILYRGSVNFKDDTLDPPFTKEIKNMALDGRISFPDKVKFDAEFDISSQLPASLKSSGEYKIREKELSLDIKARDLAISEFGAYFKKANIELPDGKIDASAALYFKDGFFYADIDMTSLGLIFSQDKINANLNCGLKAKVKYSFNNKELTYSGDLDMKNLALSDLDYVGKIDDIRGKVAFSEAKLSSRNITCTVLGVPVMAMVDLPDLGNPIMKIDAAAGLDLTTLKDILKNNFYINIPAEITGQGELKLMLQYKPAVSEHPIINGSLGTAGATLRLEYNKIPLEHVKGKIDFTRNQLIWSEVAFKYMDADYKTSGVLTNFDKPGVDLKLSSDRLALQSLLAINDKIITLSKFDGRFDNSEFSIQGDIDTKDPSNVAADVSGLVKFDLDAAKEPFKKIMDILKNSKASGRMTASFNLKGNLSDLSRAAIDAEVTSESLFIYGLKIDDFSMGYLQRNGIMNIARVSSSLYGGVLDATGMVDLISKDLPYQINADIKNLKIEKIKKDTVFKDMDISGSMQAHFGVKGFSNDLSRLNAWGKISILNGRLWQLNLFRGMGALLFKRDFNSVVFKEGSCDFFIKENRAFTNNLIMKSDLLNIYGALMAGFDNSISASLKAEFTDEGIDAGNISDIAGAIERYSIMEIGGTLKEPKYKIRPDLTSIVGDIADSFF